jgi:hypothetical protein
VSKEQLVAIFEEWARQYAEDPGAFDGVLDDDGNPVWNYGQQAAQTFLAIKEELEKQEAVA